MYKLEYSCNKYEILEHLEDIKNTIENINRKYPQDVEENEINEALTKIKIIDNYIYNKE